MRLVSVSSFAVSLYLLPAFYAEAEVCMAFK